ncbi:MAG TPA: hypothetical protein VJB06_03915 [archaeon]|nr:hypothetical protein [archaeon]
MEQNPKVDSALHVLKGAVQKVLDTPLTTSVYAEGNNGRLTVEYEAKPTEEHMKKIESLANGKIKENVAIKMFDMDRKETEQKYGKIIYDKFPIPEKIQKSQ